MPICKKAPPNKVKPSQLQLTGSPSIEVTAAPAKIGTKVALRKGNLIITIHLNTLVKKLILGRTSSAVLSERGVVTPQ